MLFLSIAHLSNNKHRLNDLIDHKYKYRLRTCDHSDLAIKTKSKAGSSIYRRMTLPKIDIQKTSSLELREEKQQVLRKNSFDDNGIEEDEGEDKPTNFIQFSNSVNVGMLSPEVKQFLRKNRIRVRGEIEKQEHSQKRKVL